MIFEFIPSPNFNFLASFGEKFNISVENDKLTIPDSLGKGYIRRFELGPGFRLLIHHYKLKEDFILRRKGVNDLSDIISIIFNCTEQLVDPTRASIDNLRLSKNNDFEIQIASTDLDFLIHYPANTEIFYIVIGIRPAVLKMILNVTKPNPVIKTITNGSSGFLFYERMDIDTQKVFKQITKANDENDFSKFYYRLKSEELLYLLFQKLSKREMNPTRPLFNSEIEKLYLLRTAILADLSKPPRLKDLSKISGLSETKMKDMFKQVFGDSIYNYYQKARMEEAAFLLKHAGLSVSETGFQLGFENLSHFARLFNKHYGLNPKKYASGG